ncbi:MAG: hypothetical protein GDA35_03680 [Hyphomonadaceae bacterium]|nr:hypothetical protein [Hyphomonadaceae bacterium]
MSDIFRKAGSTGSGDGTAVTSPGSGPVSPGASSRPETDIESRETVEGTVTSKSSETFMKHAVDDDPVPEFTHSRSMSQDPYHINSPRMPYLAIILFVVLWLVLSTVVSFVILKFQTLFDSPTPWEITGLVGFFLLPALAIALTVHAWHRLSRISALASRLEATTRQLMTPDGSVKVVSHAMIDAIQVSIEDLDEKISQSGKKLAALRAILQDEAEKMAKNSHAMGERSQVIAERMASLSRALDQHSQNLSNSTQQAGQKIQEACMNVEAITERIVSTSNIAHDRMAGTSDRPESNHKELNEETTSCEPHIPKPAVPERKTTSDNRPWWKSLPGRSGKSDTFAIDSITAPPKKDSITAPPKKDSVTVVADVVNYLEGLGLSPDAVIDNGCIEAAIEARLKSGAHAMSHAVSQKLGDVVIRLRSALRDDAASRSGLSRFAAQFHMHLENSDKIPETVRGILDTRTGRAFLLCDAALNIRTAI